MRKSRAVVFLAWLVATTLAAGPFNIHLSPDTVASVPFGSGVISVWRHANDSLRYYGLPLAYILKDSARVRSNTLTEITEMAFDILLWSDEAREAVYLHLKREVNPEVSKNNVEMLPMERIRLTWQDTVKRPIFDQKFALIDTWKSNSLLPPVVTFQFTCANRPVCEDLKNAMKGSPGDFNALELEYLINEERSERRSLTVRGRHVVQGRLWTKLNSMTGAGDTRYLTTNDLKTITSESVNNMVASELRTSAYVSTGDEVRMIDLLQNVLGRQQVSSNNFQPQQWNSVFWNADWARPDKLTNYLNQILKKDASDNRTLILDERARSRSKEGGGGVGIGELSFQANGGTSSGDSRKVQKEEFRSRLQEEHPHVQWSGEVFQVKPVKLYRLNLSALNTSTNIATSSVQVRQFQSAHALKVRVADLRRPQTPSLTPQLVQARLLRKLSERETFITESMTRQTDNKLREQKTRLTNTIQAQNTRLTNKINAKDNEGKDRLVPIQNKLNNIDDYGWSTGGYCILASGSCPRGFTRYIAELHGLKRKTTSSNRARTFGDSELNGCSVGDRRGDRTGHVKLVTCCK